MRLGIFVTLTLTGLLVSCGGDDGDSGNGDTPLGAATTSAVSIRPASNFSLQVDQIISLSAIASYSDNSSGNVTQQATWSSSNTAIAELTGKGLVKGISAGDVAITVNYDGHSAIVNATVTASTQPIAAPAWTWISGSNTANQTGFYGTQGVAVADNIPMARHNAVSWKDSAGNFWLYGGLHVGSIVANAVTLNDLWRWDGVNWTWVSGSNVPDQQPVYGTKGVASASNTPGARTGSSGWTDGNGDFWLFGGVSGAARNDLWRWDGANWTWISGTDTTLQKGVYGTQGVAAAENTPGARAYASTWIDSNGDFWLFGGSGQGGEQFGTVGDLNDLWRWDGTNWTWVSGSKATNQTGIYGVKGETAAQSIPGGRKSAISWVDSNDDFWLYGGSGYDSTGNKWLLADLWRWDGTNWTWESGSDLRSEPAVYGVQGIAAATNQPGSRENAAAWTDGSGDLWLFGGSGHNDLWRWDGVNWTWVSGSQTTSQQGVYGTLGTPDQDNIPGGRTGALYWVDNTDTFWLFGGGGSDGTGSSGELNDLWKVTP